MGPLKDHVVPCGRYGGFFDEVASSSIGFLMPAGRPLEVDCTKTGGVRQLVQHKLAGRGDWEQHACLSWRSAWLVHKRSPVGKNGIIDLDHAMRVRPSFPPIVVV